MANYDATQPDRAWLLSALEDGFFSDPRLYRQRLDFEPSPVEDMLGSSPLLDFVRERLPHKVADTRAGQWVERKLAGPDVQPGLRTDLNQQLQDLSLGGFSEETAGLRQQLRNEDPLVQRGTVQPGMVRTPDGAEEIPIGDSLRLGAAQTTGVALGDAAKDGLRNIWWFLNAPQAIASLAVLQAAHAPMKQQADRLLDQLDYQGNERPISPYGNRGVRLAAALPAVIGASMAIGNAYRQPGYKAALPSEADPTQTSDPLAELGSRYFLGRTGDLLAYDEFVKERPDVSKAEYDAYKAYLFGSASPIKASLDGINGPEVNFMGKSVPILTGVAPVIAAIAGTRRGMRKAMERLETSADGDRLAQAEQARLKYMRAERELGKPDATATLEDVNEAKKAYATAQRIVDKELLKQSLAYSAGYMAPTAIIGQTLESIRRSLPREQPPEPEPEAKAAPKKPKLQPEPATITATATAPI